MLSNIKILYSLQRNRGSVLLESHLTFQKLATSNLELLTKLVKGIFLYFIFYISIIFLRTPLPPLSFLLIESGNQNKRATPDSGEASKIMANMLKIVGGLPGVLYLHNFLEHVLALGKALERYMSILSLVAFGG